MSIGRLNQSLKETAVDNAISNAKKEYIKADEKNKNNVITSFIKNITEILRHYSYRIEELECVPKYYIIAWAENNTVVFKKICFEQLKNSSSSNTTEIV